MVEFVVDCAVEEAREDVLWLVDVRGWDESMAKPIVPITRTMTTTTTIKVVPIPLRRRITPTHLPPERFLINSYVRTRLLRCASVGPIPQACADIEKASVEEPSFTKVPWTVIS